MVSAPACSAEHAQCTVNIARDASFLAFSTLIAAQVLWDVGMQMTAKA
jgi:hypothetical protein